MSARLIIVAAPSGAGKSSFVDRICSEEPRLVDVITYTSRGMRKGECEGHPYHFISREDFERKIEQQFFVEWAQVHTSLYGNSWQRLRQAWDDGKCVIMDIDVQGTATYREKFPDAKTVFILPPSIDELRRRITLRDGGIPNDLDVRMANAEREMAEAQKFDVRIVNDNFETSFAQFKKTVADWLDRG